MDADQAYDLTKTLYEHVAEIANPLAALITAEHALDGVPEGVQIHPGAWRYYEEIGLV